MPYSSLLYDISGNVAGMSRLQPNIFSISEPLIWPLHVV